MKRNKALALLASLMATPWTWTIKASGAPATDLTPEPFLRITGDISNVNNTRANSFDFTEAMFLALPTETVATSTPWTPRSMFTGPLLVTVMRAAGVTAGTLTVRSLDDTAVSVPWSDLVRYDAILAHSQDGKRLDHRRWGPLWTIYPRDQHPSELNGPVAESRLIWQVNRIEARN